MRKSILLALATVMSLTMLLSAAPAALAEETVCRGTLRQRQVDNLLVPDGASCTLNGTRVEGNINVGTGSTLRATDVRVKGSVQAEGFRSVSLAQSAVGGQVQLVQGGTFQVERVTVTGNILVDENSGRSRLIRNTVNADIQVFANEGGVEIGNNRVDGNLQCKENVPAPTGGGNRVQGNKEDQCSRL